MKEMVASSLAASACFSGSVLVTPVRPHSLTLTQRFDFLFWVLHGFIFGALFWLLSKFSIDIFRILSQNRTENQQFSGFVSRSGVKRNVPNFW